MEADLRITLRAAFARAGLDLPEERLPAMARALETVRAVTAALAPVDFGETEPASRFRAPGLP